jgi:hypothetical protein
VVAPLFQLALLVFAIGVLAIGLRDREPSVAKAGS